MPAVILTTLVGNLGRRMKEWVKEDMMGGQSKWEVLGRNRCQGGKYLYRNTRANTMAIQGSARTYNGRSNLIMVVVKATVSIYNRWLLILVLAKVELYLNLLLLTLSTKF